VRKNLSEGLEVLALSRRWESSRLPPVQNGTPSLAKLNS
jgi:hypothetical protein